MRTLITALALMVALSTSAFAEYITNKKEIRKILKKGDTISEWTDESNVFYKIMDYKGKFYKCEFSSSYNSELLNVTCKTDYRKPVDPIEKICKTYINCEKNIHLQDGIFNCLMNKWESIDKLKLTYKKTIPSDPPCAPYE